MASFDPIEFDTTKARRLNRVQAFNQEFREASKGEYEGGTTPSLLLCVSSCPNSSGPWFASQGWYFGSDNVHLYETFLFSLSFRLISL